ncbi:MAG: hypothetical protein K8S16_10740 [Bacteroidales bacterium]|nr:hypothetical protein [Bacteroidales bacterium]
MLIERTNNKIIITIPATIDTDDLQDFIDYIRYKELTSDINIPQNQIDQLASDINKTWWENSKERFLK